VDVELRPLTVLIGANGVGKSSFLDALSLLASSAQGRLNEAVNDMAGLAAMMTYDRASEVGFGISMTVPGHKPLDYSLSLRPNGQAYLINQETLTQELGARGRRLLVESRGAGVKYDGTPATWEIGLLESALSQVPKSSREPEKFRRKLASSTFYHALNVEPRSPVRLPQTMRPATLPGRNGEDLVTSLYYLRETEPDRFEAVEDALKAAFPGFRKLDFPPVAAGTLAMLWRDSNFSQPMYTHQLSEGMLRFLWLATLLQSRGLTELTLLDEPEVSLHPELLSLLAGLLREAASRRTQIVVATHSDRLIRFLKPEEVLVMDYADDGTASLTWADQMNLEQWLEEYTLDELWSNGRLGARG
jgi:predicted ATPase